jgi:hypothetical protein
MRNDKLRESVEEKGRAYGEMLQELGAYFLRNRKRFKFALNRVSDMLDVHEVENLRTLSRDRGIESSGAFEDRFEEICWAKDRVTKRELVRLMLRHM